MANHRLRHPALRHSAGRDRTRPGAFTYSVVSGPVAIAGAPHPHGDLHPHRHHDYTTQTATSLPYQGGAHGHGGEPDHRLRRHRRSLHRDHHRLRQRRHREGGDRHRQPDHLACDSGQRRHLSDHRGGRHPGCSELQLQLRQRHPDHHAGTPTIVCNVANMVYGTPLSATQLTATLGPGAFTYSVVSGGGLGCSHPDRPHGVLHSPAADSNYAAATKTATFTVAKAVLTVTAANQTIAYGGTVAPYTATITGFVNGDTARVVTGTASLTTSPATPVNAGTYPITAAAGTLAAANYTFAFVNGTLTIGAGTPTIVWANLANRRYGTALSATPLNSSLVPGAFTYSVVSGPAAISGATVTLTVDLHPHRHHDYAAATTTATFSVAKAVLTVTAANQTIAYGGTVAPYTATITGFVNGDTASVVTGTASLTTSPATPVNAGTYPITAAAGTLAAANYSFSFVNGTLTIAPALRRSSSTWPTMDLWRGSVHRGRDRDTRPGAFTYSVVSGPAAISGATVT